MGNIAKMCTQWGSASDRRHRRLLRPRRERPCRSRTADERDEVAPFHGPAPPPEWFVSLLLCGDHPVSGIDVGWHAILASPARVLGHFYFFHDVVERLALFHLGGNAFD